jgi:nitric oxide reductase NorE protein
MLDELQGAPHPRVTGTGRHIPGEVGAWVFILGDMVLFALFFATYLVYRGHQRELFISSQHHLVQGYGVINTLLLLTSSLFVVLAMRALRRDQAAGHDSRTASLLFSGALVCGVCFGAMKLLEWGDKLSTGITPATNDFFMFFFTLTGLHFLHLLIGMVVLAFLIKVSRSPKLLGARELGYVEGGACFWHMVDLLWIVLFPLLYLVR